MEGCRGGGKQRSGRMQGRGKTEEWKGAGEGVNRGVEGCRGGGKQRSGRVQGRG